MATITKNGKVMGRPKGVEKVRFNLSIQPSYKELIIKYAKDNNTTASELIEGFIQTLDTPK